MAHAHNAAGMLALNHKHSKHKTGLLRIGADPGFDKADLIDFKKPYPYLIGGGMAGLLGLAIYFDFFKKHKK